MQTARRSSLIFGSIVVLFISVACGDDDTSPATVGGPDASSPDGSLLSDTGSSGGDATSSSDGAKDDGAVAADAGQVTSLYGTFHEGNGGEHNLTIKNDNTWLEQNWLCGGGGGGGGCGGGVVQANGNTLTLVASPDAGLMSWFHGQVTSVTVTIVSGKLHTVTTGQAGGEETIDFSPGYECYIDCGKDSTVGPCTTPRQCS